LPTASPSASLYHGHLYHGPSASPLSLLTIAITVPCLLGGFILEKAHAAWNYSGLFAVGSSEILLVDREFVQSGVLTQATCCGSIGATSSVEDGIL